MIRCPCNLNMPWNDVSHAVCPITIHYVAITTLNLLLGCFNSVVMLVRVEVTNGHDGCLNLLVKN